MRDRPLSANSGLWTAAAYKVPRTIVVASNAEYGVLKQFGKIEHTNGVPGLDLPGLDIVATAKSYGVSCSRSQEHPRCCGPLCRSHEEPRRLHAH
jgi:benzoylformate decarboxylase